MGYQLTPFMAVYASIFVLTASLGLYAALRYLRYDRRLPALAFAVLMFSIAVWELNTFLLEMVTDAELKLLSNNVTNAVVIPIYLFSLLFFALSFAEHERWVKWVVVLPAVTVAVLGGALLYDPEFLYESRGLVTRGPVTVLGFTFEEYVLHDRRLNPPFRVYALYSYVITLASAVVLTRYVLTEAEELHTEQSLLIGVGIATPLLLNLLIFFGLLPPALNFTDIGFGVTGVCFGIAVFRYRLFELPPIGRQQVVNVLDDPLVFLNNSDEIVHSNPRARELFDVGADWKGMEATEFFAAHADRLQPPDAGGLTRDGTIELDGGDRYFDVNSTTVRTPTGETAGRAIVLREVTELEKTNRRLDQFASMVSHDLRNPLTTAAVQTNRLARERADDRTEAVQDALDRMEAIIDDMLRLARAGETVETTEACSLADVVDDAWDTIETDGARLDCRVGDATVDADPVRLFQLLENLLRNALDHNDTPPTVRVGTFGGGSDPAAPATPAGFFVEDDGSGIPEDKREAIFDHGHTTNRDGHGVGLSVVRYIAEAHGWAIRVTDGADGGARFEITGIEAG